MQKTTTPAVGAYVHERIRADILQGVHAPGSPLRLAALAGQFSVSTSLIREVLVRLSEQHLAVLTPNQGFRVVSISRSDLLELTELRVMIEGSALARSIERGDIAWEAGVIAAHHVLERTDALREDEPGSTDEWSLAHDRFHVALISACGSNRMLTLAHSLRASAEVYLQLSAGSTRDPALEHAELVRFAIDRHPSLAREALERHIRLTTELLLGTAALDGVVSAL